MNKLRRKKIENLISTLEEIKLNIELIRDEEQEAYDNLPESFQEGEKGEKMSTCVDNLDNAFSSIEDCINSLQESVE